MTSISNVGRVLPVGVGVDVEVVVGALLIVADWAIASAANCSNSKFMSLRHD
ncbi:unnamed protein product [Periconia digitata]|uniref:Uncharacterized protein n=1 Tax=Periconia digitata TaxID=1303443 RepID=A0A9W4U8Y9_9PLEO|nr:unnamed protein product [Periconia digitata]